jgi:hypothetical protein
MSQPVGGSAGSGGAAIQQALQHVTQQPTPVPYTPPPLVNNVQNNPGLESALAAAAARARQLQAQEGRPDPYQQESIRNLRNRMSADTTQHAIDRAGNAIKTQAAGMQTALDAQMARRGLGQSGLAARGASGLTEAAQRDQARSASDISLGREQQLDALALGGNSILQAPSQLGLQQQGLSNTALGLQMQGAGALANQGLAQQGYGLQQWQAQNSAAMQAQQLQQQQQQMQWQQLMALLGLTGGAGGGGFTGGYA